MIDFKALQACFPAEDIEWRIQQAGEKNGKVWALCIAYVTNRAIQTRLDEVVGPDNWKNEFLAGPNGGVVCGLSIRVDREDGCSEWVTKWDGADNTDIEQVKGGLSGAMKRAAVQWGIGRYLYELEEEFADVREDGRMRGKVKGRTPGEDRSFRWNPPKLPAWAVPGSTDAPRDSSTDRDPGSRKMPIGQHKDIPLRDVPTKALQGAKDWCTEKDAARWADLVADIDAVLAEREG
jgi:hypothetical protein